jgi:TM2 domain-containing membrane protein YozV
MRYLNRKIERCAREERGLGGSACRWLSCIYPGEGRPAQALSLSACVGYPLASNIDDFLSLNPERKDPVLAYALWCLSFVGLCGVQRMYLGQIGLGVVMLFSFGCCGVAQLFDLFLLPGAVKEANARLGISGSGSSVPPSRPDADLRPVALAPASVVSRSGSAGSKAGDDELDRLLRQAEESVNRAQKSSYDA